MMPRWWSISHVNPRFLHAALVVAALGEQIVLVLRAVNFTAYQTPNDAPIHTRNFLLRLSPALDIESSAEILAPANLPEPAYKHVLGFEDLRLFVWREALWCNATVRELTAEGWCQQVLARIDKNRQVPCRLADWRVLAPEGPTRHEKNWIPLVVGDRLQFIYQCDPTRALDDAARTVAETAPAIAAEQFRGSSQAIEFDGGRVALVHEVLRGPSENQEEYHHRFVWFDETGVLLSLSRPFYFRKRGIELATGLGWHPDGKRLLISYGVNEGEAWIATVDPMEVRAVLSDGMSTMSRGRFE